MKASGIESRHQASSIDENSARKGPALSKKRRFMNAAKLGTFAVSSEYNDEKYGRKAPSLGCAPNLKEAPAWMRTSESDSEDDSKIVPSTINVPGSSESQQEELSQIDNLSSCQTEEVEEAPQTQRRSQEFSLLFQGQSSHQRERAMHLLSWDCSTHKETRRAAAPLSPASSQGFSHLFGNQPELGRTAESLLSFQYQTPKAPKPLALGKSIGQSNKTDIRPISPDHSARTARSAVRKQFDAAQALLNLPYTERKHAQAYPNPMGPPPPIRPSALFQPVYPGVGSSATQQSSGKRNPSAVDAMAMAYLAELHQQSTMASPYILNFHLGWSENAFKR